MLKRLVLGFDLFAIGLQLTKIAIGFYTYDWAKVIDGLLWTAMIASFAYLVWRSPDDDGDDGDGDGAPIPDLVLVREAV